MVVEIESTHVYVLQMMFKNLTDNAKNLAANAKIEDMSKLFKNHMAGKPDVKNALSGVMVSVVEILLLFPDILHSLDDSRVLLLKFC